VTIRYDAAGAVARLTMRQLQPAFGAVAAAPAVARMLGLPEAALDPRRPAQEVSTGLPFLIAPVRDLAAMRAIRLDPAHVAAGLEGLAADAVLVFCRETEDAANGIHARVFVPAMGIPEDPATGSANGCLLAYLLQHEVLGAGPVDVRVEQGVEMGRPSVLYLSGRREAGGFTIAGGARPAASRSKWAARRSILPRAGCGRAERGAGHAASRAVRLRIARGTESVLEASDRDAGRPAVMPGGQGAGSMAAPDQGLTLESRRAFYIQGGSDSERLAVRWSAPEWIGEGDRLAARAERH
jgi:hypothetical protein